MPPRFSLPLFVVHQMLICASAFGSAKTSSSEPCTNRSDGTRSYYVCSFDLAHNHLRLFWKNSDGEPYGSVPAVSSDLATEGRRLVFAMTAGMFHSDLSPVGLYIEKGNELRKANSTDGIGNFFLKPNGVFFFNSDTAGILETSRFLEAKPKLDYAFQSGPMILSEGKIHPRFAPTDPYMKIRSAVGIKDRSSVFFVISEGPVLFYDLAIFMRDKLGCQNALNLDGTSAGLRIPARDRSDRWLPIGPIVGVTAPIKNRK